MWFASKHQIARGKRVHPRYWTLGIKQCHGPKLRSLLPTSQQFLAGKLDGKWYGPDFAFPVLNCAATQSEHFPCRNLIDSQLLPPLFEVPLVHNVILELRNVRALPSFRGLRTVEGSCRGLNLGALFNRNGRVRFARQSKSL